MDSKQLTRAWIQYLKSLKIVDLNSDENGKLNYKRPVTVDDVATFLDVKTEYTLDEIKNAVAMVLTKKGLGNQPDKLNQPGPKEPGRDLSTWMYYGMRPGEHPTKRVGADDAVDVPQVQGKETNKLKYDPDSISDIDYRDVPPEEPKRLGAPQKPEEPRKPRFRLRKVKEDITDNPGAELDEKDVELIFNMLTSGNTSKSASQSDDEISALAGNLKKANAEARPRKNGPAPEEPPSPQKKLSPEQQAKKEEELRKLKRVIRDVMTDSQRKALWRLLKDTDTLTENHISNADIKEILRTAADSRSKPSGLGRLFKGLRKDKIDMSDLQRSWADAGYPDDTRDISKLLLSYGFNEKEIKKVYSQVFGKDKDSDDPDVPTSTERLLKIAKFIKQNNLTQDVIQFMQDEFEFKESENFRKLAIEEVRQIFEQIIREERTNRDTLIRLEDRELLGRNKK